MTSFGAGAEYFDALKVDPRHVKYRGLTALECDSTTCGSPIVPTFYFYLSPCNTVHVLPWCAQLSDNANIALTMTQAHVDDMLIVPYEQYASKRKQYGWRRKPVIQFRTHGSAGICLESALHHRSPGLESPHEAVLEGCGDKVSYHVHVSTQPHQTGLSLTHMM